VNTGGTPRLPLPASNPFWLNNVWPWPKLSKKDSMSRYAERAREVTEWHFREHLPWSRRKVLTPPLNSGCLEGVTRGILMEIAREAGVSVSSRRCGPKTCTPQTKFLFLLRTAISSAPLKSPVLRFPLLAPSASASTTFRRLRADYVSRRLASAAR